MPLCIYNDQQNLTINDAAPGKCPRLVSILIDPIIFQNKTSASLISNAKHKHCVWYKIPKHKITPPNDDDAATYQHIVKFRNILQTGHSFDSVSSHRQSLLLIIQTLFTHLIKQFTLHVVPTRAHCINHATQIT